MKSLKQILLEKAEKYEIVKVQSNDYNDNKRIVYAFSNDDGNIEPDDTFIFYPLDENQEQMIIKTIMNIERK